MSGLQWGVSWYSMAADCRQTIPGAEFCKNFCEVVWREGVGVLRIGAAEFLRDLVAMRLRGSPLPSPQTGHPTSDSVSQANQESHTAATRTRRSCAHSALAAQLLPSELGSVVSSASSTSFRSSYVQAHQS